MLPLKHPLRIAEEAATVDHISEGRLDFGIGRSGSPRSYDIYGVPYGESRARFKEALEIILQAWKGDAFSYVGEFYRFNEVTISPRPYQQPHPPLRMAAASGETFPLVGQLGLPIFVGLRALELPQLAEHLRAYRRAWRQAGHPGAGSVSLRIPIYLGPSSEAATAEPRASTMLLFSRQAALARASVGREGAGPAAQREAEVARLESLTYDEILRTKVAFGTRRAARRSLAPAPTRAPGSRGSLRSSTRAVSSRPNGSMRSLRLLTHEVMPALK